MREDLAVVFMILARYIDSIGLTIDQLKFLLERFKSSRQFRQKIFKKIAEACIEELTNYKGTRYEQ